MDWIKKNVVVVYSILLAIELLIVTVLLSNAFPLELSPAVKSTFLMREQNNITPKRDLQLYMFFGCLCFAIYAGLALLSRNRSSVALDIGSSHIDHHGSCRRRGAGAGLGRPHAHGRLSLTRDDGRL